MLKGPDLKALDAALELIEFSCRAVLAGFVDDEEDAASTSDHPVYKSVYVRPLHMLPAHGGPLLQQWRISSDLPHCATAEDLQDGAGTEGFYPICCFANKPKLAKGKRKLFTEQ